MSADAERIRAALARHGGVIAALAALADQVREAGDAVAGAIEAVALELDRERRGALSIPARHDAVELAATIRSLLHDPLLDAQGRRALGDRVANGLTLKQRRRTRAR